eukprot:6193648-Pleurochrysis_carterae.AAC.1
MKTETSHCADRSHGPRSILPGSSRKFALAIHKQLSACIIQQSPLRSRPLSYLRDTKIEITPFLPPNPSHCHQTTLYCHQSTALFPPFPTHLLDATDKHALERLFEAVEVEERKLLAAAVAHAHAHAHAVERGCASRRGRGRGRGRGRERGGE